MGAVDTMELFFELLNSGDRDGAVALMDEKAEMRVVGGNARTLRACANGGWFLRAEPGLRRSGDVGTSQPTVNLLVVQPVPANWLDSFQ
jgi:hypothetical protein